MNRSNLTGAVHDPRPVRINHVRAWREPRACRNLTDQVVMAMQPTVRFRSNRSAPPIPLVLTVAAVTLVLSPIIAVWAAVLGAVLCVLGLLMSALRGGPAGLTTALGAGLLLGAAPYFALALFQ